MAESLLWNIRFRSCMAMNSFLKHGVDVHEVLNYLGFLVAKVICSKFFLLFKCFNYLYLCSKYIVIVQYRLCLKCFKSH